MDFKAMIGNVTDKASHLAKSAAKKTGEVAEQAKLSLSVRAEKNKLEEMYTTLGKLFYEQVKGTDVRAQVTAQVMEIDEQKLVIKNLSEEITEYNGQIICDGCGKKMSLEDSFCPNCGKKLEAKKPSVDTENKKDEASDKEPPSEGDDNFTTAFEDVTDKYFS